MIIVIQRKSRIMGSGYIEYIGLHHTREDRPHRQEILAQLKAEGLYYPDIRDNIPELKEEDLHADFSDKTNRRSRKCN